MDKILEKSLLFDFYGDLLTEKQKVIYEMYYLNDFSLNEIAEEHGVTPQAVRDLVNRTDKMLTHYEEKLFMIERHIRTKQAAEDALGLLEDYLLKGIISQEAALELKERINAIMI